MYSALILFLMCQGAVGPETPPDVEVAAAEVSATQWWAPLGGSVTLDHAIGLGTFVAGQKTDNPYYASSLTFQPSWSFDDDLAINLFHSLWYEWTYLVTPCHPAAGPRAAGAPARDCSDADGDDGNRFDQTDLSLSLAHSALLELGPVAFSGWSGVSLPTSRASRFTSNLFTLGIGGGATFAEGPLTLSASLGFSKFFPTAEAAVLDAIESEARTGDGLPRGNCAALRQSSCLLLSGFVPTWRLNTDLTATIEIPWVPGLSGMVYVSYLYSRQYGRDDDGFRSRSVDEDGDPIVDGVNTGDSTIGSIALSYQLSDRFSVSLGTYSLQPARTEDGKSIRFPFYDFVSPANNFTTWYAAGTVSL